MRKINKIMMMTVAILLSLVLITSSVVSGTLAKYTTSSSSSDSARVAKWGVTVEASYGKTFKNAMDAAKIKPNDDGIQITIDNDNFRMGPGDDFSDAIHFKITGTAEVKLMVKITADASYKTDTSTSGFKVPKDVAGLTEATVCIPFGLTLGVNGTNKYCVNPCASQRTEAGTAQAIRDRLGFEYKAAAGEVKTPYAYKVFDPNTPITFGTSGVSVNEFELGFKWPKTYEYNGSEANYDEVCTWLTQNRNPVFTMNYIVTIEQVNE